MIQTLRQKVTYDANRGRQLKRILHLIILLSGRGYPLAEIAERMECSIKTVRRDLVLIESCDIPVYVESAQLETAQFVKLYRVDPRWMSRRLQEGSKERVTKEERRTGISWSTTVPVRPKL